MKIRNFQLERYFAKYEFSVEHLLSPSDCETWTVEEILALEEQRSGENGVDRLKNLRLSYTESQGSPTLLDAIDGTYGGIFGREGLVVGCPEELIFLFLNGFLEAGDRVVVISPAYQSLYELPRSIGCEVVFLPLCLESGALGKRWVWDIEKLESLLRFSTKLLIVNFPHNPTGYMPSPEEHARIGELAAQYGVTVFSDEMYRGLELDGPPLPAFAELENAVTLCGTSKGLGLPGLRLGWLASRRRDLIAPVLSLKDYTTICNSAPSEFLAELALHGASSMLSRNRDILRANVDLASRFFERHSDALEWIPPTGGPTAFPRLLRGDVTEMCARAALEKSLMILPDRVFDVEDNRFRVGMGRKNFPKALEVFGEFLEENWKS